MSRARSSTVVIGLAAVLACGLEFTAALDVGAGAAAAASDLAASVPVAPYVTHTIDGFHTPSAEGSGVGLRFVEVSAQPLANFIMKSHQAR